MQECAAVLFHRKKTKNNHKNVRKTCYWKLIFVICSCSTWAGRHAKHTRHAGTWARKARKVWARRQARQVGMSARKHAGHVGTWACTQPTFQRRINVVSTLCINVEITLIRRWKWNKIRHWIFNAAQRWYNVSARRWNNVETTLIQSCFNLVSTLLKPILNPIGPVMIVDCVI